MKHLHKTKTEIKTKKQPKQATDRFGVLSAVICEQKENRLFGWIMEFLIAALYTYGVLLLLCDITMGPAELDVVLPLTGMLGGAVFAAWYAFLFTLKKGKKAILLRIATAVVLVGALLFLLGDLTVGTQMLWYGVRERAYDVMKLRLPEWELVRLTLYAANKGTAALFAAAAAVTALLGTVVIKGVRRLIPYILLILPPMLGCYYLTEVTADGVFCMLLVSLFGMLGVVQQRHTAKKTAKKAIIAVKAGAKRVSGAIFAVGAAAVILVTGVLPRAAYERPAILREFMLNPMGTIERFLIGTIGSAVAPTASAGMSGGRLGEVDTVVFENSERLRVENLPKEFDSFFLKGYTGVYYDGDSFDERVVPGVAELALTLSEGTTLYETVLSNAEKAKTMFGEPDMWQRIEIRKTHITDLRIYAPYFIRKVSPSLREFYAYELDSDRGILRYGYFDDDYEVQIPIGFDRFTGASLSKLSANSGDWLERLSDFEHTEALANGTAVQSAPHSTVQKYSMIAYENYLQLPPDGRFNWIVEQLADKESLSERFNAVKELVQEGNTYTRSPGKTPAGKDFVNHFLLENKKGYCMHFAAATVIAFRAANIPARYCEGYTVRDTDFVGDTVVVNDSRAHAWCEIYLAEVGWVPVDFTPADASAIGNPTRPENSEPEESDEDEEYSHPIATLPSEPESSADAPQNRPESSDEETDTPGGWLGGWFGGGGENPGNPGMLPDLSFLQPILLGTVYVLAVCGVLAALFGVLVHRKNRAQRQRQERLQMRSAAEVCAVYGDILALWRYAGIVQRPGERDEALAARADKAFPFVGITAADALAVAEQARYADKAPGMEDCARLRQYYKDLRRKLLRRMKGGRRFVFEWLKRM